MDTSFFDALTIKKMASGHAYLSLSENISWETFPDFSKRLLKMIDGQLIQKFDSFDIRIWEVNVCGCALQLVFDDYPIMVSLESSDSKGDALLEKIYRDLSEKTHSVA